MELQTMRPQVLDPARLKKNDLWQLLDDATGGIWLVDLVRNEVFWSPRLARTFGLDLAGERDVPDIIEMTHPDDRRRHQDTVDASLLTRTNYEIEVRMRDRGGQSVWLQANGLWLGGEGKQPTRMIGFVRDVTDKVLARLALRRSEVRFRSFFDQAPAAVFIKDRHSRHVYGNSVAAEYAGVDLEDFMDSTAFDLFTPDVARALDAVDQKVIRDGKTVNWTGPIRVPGGGARQVLDVKFPVEDVESGERLVGGFGIDVTELHEMKQQLTVAQRLESLGLLAAGVAHDFNNLLFSISGEAELAMAEATEAGREHLKSILTATSHAADLCRQLLEVGGQARTAPRAVDVAQLLRESGELLELSAQSRCRLEIEAPPGGGLIRADQAQLRQVLVNLVVNAAQASEPGDRVELGCFDTSLRWLDESVDRSLYSWLPADATDGICIYVEDHGQGIERAELERIFEPYFTGHERGHGLGLATVLGTVKSHRGALRVQSEPGVGTRFECYFPAFDGAPEETAEAASNAQPGHGMAKAMVIDDDESITRITAAMLRNAGVDAECFTNSVEALDALRRRHAEFDIVLTDVSMPDAGGLDVLRTVRELDATVPVILASGFGDNRIDLEGDARAWFLQKPWSGGDLEGLLAEIGAVRNGNRDSE